MFFRLFRDGSIHILIVKKDIGIEYRDSSHWLWRDLFLIDLFHYPIVRPITGTANLQREIPELSSVAPLLHRCNCCRMHPAIPYSRAICAGSCCRCNLLTLQGGLLPVRTAGRGVKIGCDILNRPKSVIRKNGELENTPYCLRDHRRGNDQERRIVVRKRNKRT